MTPNIAIVHLAIPNWRTIRLWLPLFLLWIPLILLLPLIFVVVCCLCLAGRISPWRAIASFWALSCALPRTDVRVCTEGNRVLVRIL